MLQAISDFLPQTPGSGLLTSTSQKCSPTNIRESIADLVCQNRLMEADALSYEAMLRFPQSEDILVIRALVTQVRQDWFEASKVLEKLTLLQGRDAPVVTWRQWVRVLRCQGDDVQAMSVVTQGLANHAQDEELMAEFNTLQLAGVNPSLKAA